MVGWTEQFWAVANLSSAGMRKAACPAQLCHSPFDFMDNMVSSGVQMRATHLQQCALLRAELARLTDTSAKAIVATRLKWLQALQQHQDWAVTLIPDAAVASRWAWAAIDYLTCNPRDCKKRVWQLSVLTQKCGLAAAGEKKT